MKQYQIEHMKKIYVSIMIIAFLSIGFGTLFIQYYKPPPTAASLTNNLPMAPQYIANFGQNKVIATSANGNNAIVLRWNTPLFYQNATQVSFNVYRGTSQGLETYIGVASPSQSAFLDQSVQPGQIYWYYVTCVFSNGVTGLIAPEISVQN